VVAGIAGDVYSVPGIEVATKHADLCAGLIKIVPSQRKKVRFTNFTAVAEALQAKVKRG
jgi:hypothetical protein